MPTNRTLEQCLGLKSESFVGLTNRTGYGSGKNPTWAEENHAQEYVIEHGIPLPTNCRGKWGALKELLAHMAIGDSVVVPNKTAGAAFYKAAHNLQMKILWRKINKSQVRLWRVK